MRFIESSLKGVFLIEIERIEDERGFFARSYCQREFTAHGIDLSLVQCNLSFNSRKHTLRGLHYQATPFSEDKLIRCTMGAIYDVIVDVRHDSATFRQWVAVELTAENRRMLFVPKGFAHGFKTLSENSEVFYQMSEFYMQEAARGIRWNDPALAIVWPPGEPILSERDLSYPDFRHDG
jgi:dTDP-4-dehydrorhamnose 3,5-epimerase